MVRLLGRFSELAAFPPVPIRLRAYLKVMDIPIDAAALGPYAAHTVVNAMVTEGWQEFRDRLTRLLAKHGADGDAELAAAVDFSQEQLAEVEDEDAEVLQRASVRRISVRFEEFLSRHPEALEELRSLLAEHCHRPSNSYSVGSQNAVATRHGQVFQSAGAQTINLARPNR